MSKSFYITTPIYYPNAKPHVGTAYTTIICDVVARYNKLKGYDVNFLTGVDEHGQKIQEAAVKNGFTPQEWVDKMSADFKNLWEKLEISNTDFMRTTQERHIISVKEIVKKVNENGDIYKGEYWGKYCVSEETFVPENQLVDGKYMGKEVIDVKEISYFFRLSKYGDKLLDYIEKNPNFIKPVGKKNEVIAFIKQGLQDLSISRTTFDWGIPLELEEGHVIYVWFDALTNYITGAGYGTDPEKFLNMWTNGKVHHVLGKDILRFHAIIWPAMLMSAGIDLPETLAAHGWWTVEGEKMSKSLGNVINPEEEIKKYGLDQFRYYLMREATFGQDADYSKKSMIQRINSDLANDLGNLLNRTLGMQKKYFSSIVEIDKKVIDKNDEELEILWSEVLKNVDVKMNDYQFSEVLKEIWKFISRLNKYIDECEPWNLFKNEENINRLNTVMYNLLDGIYKVAVILSPFIPNSSKEILNQLGIDTKIENMTIKNIEKWGTFPTKINVNEAKPIFPRINLDELTNIEYNKNIKIENPINIDDFNKINIKVVEILKVEKVNGADKLLKFIVNTGNENRQILSGIAKWYENTDELIGKKVMAVLNLETAEIKGEVSQGMLLTTTEKKKTKLIEIDTAVKVGTIIK